MIDSRRVVPRVLVVSSQDLTPVLGRTVLWRSGIDRLFSREAEQALATARQALPNLVVVDGGLPGATELLHTLRSDGATRRLSLAAIADAEGEGPLRLAGANLVLPSPVEPAVWDQRLEELLDVPPRRESRLYASFNLWCRSDAGGDLHEALVLNMSVRGMLIETQEALPVGSTVDLRLTLPGAEPVPLVGLVVRTAPAEPGRFRNGVQFLILRDPVRDRLRTYIEAEAKE
jgi:CheY-like chemotaxis protein